MNERIKLLAEQADAYADVMDYIGKNYIGLRDTYFAEMIVRECAESLWTEECYNSDLALEEFEKNSKKIREHFGVEE